MPLDTGYEAPSLETIITLYEQRLVSAGLTRVRVPRSAPWVLARVWAGMDYLVYRFLAAIAEQILPDTATAETLRRHAAIWGVTPQPAEQATGTVEITGGQASAVQPAGSLLTSAEGVEYTTDAELTLNGSGEGSVDVTAVDAGEDGNAAADVELSFASPAAGVPATATVGALGLTGGTDDESDDSLRARLLARITDRPQGGAEADYVTWAQEVAGVDGVWVIPLDDGPGTVTVYFTVEDDGDGIIPDAGEVADVQTEIDSSRPVTADVTVAAPVALTVDLTITAIPDSAAIHTAVEAELEAMLARRRGPGETIRNAHWRNAIQDGLRQVDADAYYVLNDLNGDGDGLSDVTQGANEVAVLGLVTWVA